MEICSLHKLISFNCATLFGSNHKFTYHYTIQFNKFILKILRLFPGKPKKVKISHGNFAIH